MSLQIQLKKSAVTQKQPFASDLAIGELALNYNADGPFLTCKDTAGNVRKLNNVWVAATASSNPSAGDLWLDTSAATPVLKVYKDSSSTWVNATTVPLASTSAYGTVQLATTADITNGTAGKVVDAAQLQSKVTTEISGALNANPLYLQSVVASGTITATGLNVTSDLSIAGNLTVTGTTTTLDSTTVTIEDKNIELGLVASPTNTTANGGGITLKGTTDKTWTWLSSTNSWTSSEHINLVSGKNFRINNVEVLSATALGSSVQISSANIPDGTIVNSDINASAAIADTKLATISTAGKVSNSATTATNNNTASAIVARDASGNFSAGTITAALSGNASTATNLSSNRTFALTGDITGSVSSDLAAGASIATAIGSEVIVNADISPSAGITYSKLQDVSATDKLLGRSSAGAGDVEEITCTAAGRALLDDADAAAQRATLGLEIGTDVQAYDATLLNDADIGVTVQSYDAATAKTDEAQTYTAGQRGEVTVLLDAATIAVDLNDSNFFSVTLSDNRTLGNPTNMVPGQSGAIFITQDATGTRTLAYESNWDFAGGTVPALSTVANSVDVLVYMVRTSTSIVGHLIKDIK
jgi:hypothetical protein